MLRTVHIDFRAQKLTFPALLRVMEELASLGYNALLMEYMDSFPFHGRLASLKAPDALTEEELHALLRRAEELGLLVIPLLQCFGHSYWVLRHPEFEHLAEGYYPGMPEEEKVYPWGWMKLHTMCASSPEVSAFWREMVAQVLDAHPKLEYFHIGGDEIKIPSCPTCSARVKQNGMPKLLADHYLTSAEPVILRGIQPIMWADVALAYPETLPLLADKVILMDWDYQSVGAPSTHARLWGQQELLHEPDKWSEVSQRYFRAYFYAHEPDLINPFPFVRALKAAGCRVMLACSARSGNDSFCIPGARHIPNVEACVSYAEKNALTGFCITSWAVRRAPWPLTTYPFFSATILSRDPSISREEIDRAYALEHFGTADEVLGGLPAFLGAAVDKATKVSAVICSYNEFSDKETGLFFGLPYDVSCFYQSRESIATKHPERVKGAYEELRKVLEETRVRLGRAAPVTDRQRYHVSLWHWALDVLTYFCDTLPLLADKEPDRSKITPWVERAEELKAESRRLLSEIYTAPSVESGCVTRFDHMTSYLLSQSE